MRVKCPKCETEYDHEPSVSFCPECGKVSKLERTKAFELVSVLIDHFDYRPEHATMQKLAYVVNEEAREKREFPIVSSDFDDGYNNVYSVAVADAFPRAVGFPLEEAALLSEYDAVMVQESLERFDEMRIDEVCEEAEKRFDSRS